MIFLTLQNPMFAKQGENLRPVWEMEKLAGVQMGTEQGGDEQLQVRTREDLSRLYFLLFLALCFGVWH